MKLTSTDAEGLQCPACGEQAMTSSEKRRLGPGRTRACRSCGKQVSVPWAAVRRTWPLIGCVLLAFAVFVIGGSVLNGLDAGGATQAIKIVVLGVVPIALLIAGFAWGSTRVYSEWSKVPLEVRGPARNSHGASRAKDAPPLG